MKAITIIAPAVFLLSACGGSGVDNIRYGQSTGSTASNHQQHLFG